MARLPADLLAEIAKVMVSSSSPAQPAAKAAPPALEPTAGALRPRRTTAGVDYTKANYAPSGGVVAAADRVVARRIDSELHSAVASDRCTACCGLQFLASLDAISGYNEHELLICPRTCLVSPRVGSLSAASTPPTARPCVPNRWL